MKKPFDLAIHFFSLAQKDFNALNVLSKSEAVDDSVIEDVKFLVENF